MIAITAAGLSDLGCQRISNEDRVLIDVEHSVFVLADGMGGEKCGALAAELAVQSIGDCVREDTADALLRDRILHAVEFANRTVWTESKARVECTGMGSTLSALFINGSQAAIANIGDSRVYLYRDRQLQCLTRDDAVVTNLIEAGQITPAMARTHPLRNVLTSALGRTQEISIQILEASVEPGDWLMLSSDGLHGVLDDEQIAQNFANPSEPGRLAENLVSQARELGGPDNISCILVVCRNVSP